MGFGTHGAAAEVDLRGSQAFRVADFPIVHLHGLCLVAAVAAVAVVLGRRDLLSKEKLIKFVFGIQLHSICVSLAPCLLTLADATGAAGTATLTVVVGDWRGATGGAGVGA